MSDKTLKYFDSTVECDIKQPIYLPTYFSELTHSSADFLRAYWPGGTKVQRLQHHSGTRPTESPGECILWADQEGPKLGDYSITVVPDPQSLQVGKTAVVKQSSSLAKIPIRFPPLPLGRFSQVFKLSANMRLTSPVSNIKVLYSVYKWSMLRHMPTLCSVDIYWSEWVRHQWPQFQHIACERFQSDIGREFKNLPKYAKGERREADRDLD